MSSGTSAFRLLTSHVQCFFPTLCQSVTLLISLTGDIQSLEFSCFSPQISPSFFLLLLPFILNYISSLARSHSSLPLFCYHTCLAKHQHQLDAYTQTEKRLQCRLAFFLTLQIQDHRLQLNPCLSKLLGRESYTL